MWLNDYSKLFTTKCRTESKKHNHEVGDFAERNVNISKRSSSFRFDFEIKAKID